MSTPKIAICIPTYNRAHSLENCLNSIAIASKGHKNKFEVCISDNNSTDHTSRVVGKYQNCFQIKYHKNAANLGIPRNFLKVVSLASTEFIWLIGDDDLLLPDTFDRLLPLLDENPNIDFFYLNSFHLDLKYINSRPHPINTKELPKNMERFSKSTISRELPFFNLVDPRISFDFLGGMFLSAFRKSNWDMMVDKLDPEHIKSTATFSHFDNTFPHLKIWANAFSKSVAYFNAEPMNICITGVREWAPLEPLVRNIRLVEALDNYRENGMPYWRYWYCKNFALRNYFSCTLNMIIHRDVYQFKLSLLKHFFSCALYPNVYLSPFYLLIRKIQLLHLKLRK